MKKSIKLVSVALASLMAASAFSITASALPRPTKEECEAVGEQKIYFEFPDGTWGDWSNLKINKLNNTLPVYCNPYAVYGNEKEFFDPGWETKPGQCTYTGEGKTVYYDINSEMSINHYSEVDDKGKKVKLYYYRYMETEPGKDYGVLFSTTANGGFQTADVNMTADCLGDTVVLDDPISTRENAANSAKSDYFAHWKNHSDLVTKANVLSTGKFVDGQFPQNQPKAQMLSNALKEYLTNFINVGFFQLESNQKIMEKLGVTPQEVYDQYMKDNADIINGGTVEPANPDKTDVDNGCPVDFIRYDKVKLNMDIEHKKLASPKEVRKVLGLPEEEPTTAAPTTEEPTEAPTTVAPTTEAPTTEAPTTEAPTTVAPTTEAPTTEAPTTEPKPAEDVFVLAGSSNFVSTGWSPDPDSYKMTKGDDGVYSVVVPEVAAEEGALYQVKVVQFVGGDPANAVWHGMDNTDLNYDFMLSQDCDVTVTYNPATGEINVTGDGVVPPVYNISKITAVGAGQGNFLNGIVWDPDAADNQMTEVKPGVYEITFEDCDTNTDYQFKFAANGGWDMNWGLVKETEAKLNEPNPAQYNSDNILFNVESEEETVDVTLQLDISNWDTVKKGGATYTIFINRETPVLWGDVDGDGVITTNDATYVQKYSIDLPTTDNFNAAVADVNADGRISVLDATCIQKFVAEFKNGTGRTGQPVVFE
nr:dockerin type I domain-containing protein [uncultured Ruminococcus sp.]